MAEHKIKRLKRDEVMCGLCRSDENELVFVEETHLQLAESSLSYGMI